MRLGTQFLDLMGSGFIIRQMAGWCEGSADMRLSKPLPISNPPLMVPPLRVLVASERRGATEDVADLLERELKLMHCGSKCSTMTASTR
jgi:hypothetical protein